MISLVWSCRQIIGRSQRALLLASVSWFAKLDVMRQVAFKAPCGMKALARQAMSSSPCGFHRIRRRWRSIGEETSSMFADRPDIVAVILLFRG